MEKPKIDELKRFKTPLRRGPYFRSNSYFQISPQVGIKTGGYRWHQPQPSLKSLVNSKPFSVAWEEFNTQRLAWRYGLSPRPKEFGYVLWEDGRFTPAFTMHHLAGYTPLCASNIGLEVCAQSVKALFLDLLKIGICHKDLHTKNVLVNRSGTKFYAIDFEFVRIMDYPTKPRNLRYYLNRYA